MRVVIGIGLLTTLCLPAAAADGTASGTFTVNGKAATLTHAYAVREPDPFDKTKQAVRVVLSDKPLTADAIADPFALQKMMRSGQLHAVVAVIDSDKQVASTMLYDAGFNMDSVSVAGTNNKLDLKNLSAGAIAGRLYTQKPDSFGKATYEFAATFDAPIAVKAPPSGPPPADSPITKAVMDYYKAARSGSAAAIKQAVTADAGKELDGPDGKQIVEFLKAMSPANPKITNVEMNGDKAVVSVESKEGDTTSTEKLNLVKVGAAWKVNPKG